MTRSSALQGCWAQYAVPSAQEFCLTRTNLCAIGPQTLFITPSSRLYRCSPPAVCKNIKTMNIGISTSFPSSNLNVNGYSSGSQVYGSEVHWPHFPPISRCFRPRGLPHVHRKAQVTYALQRTETRAASRQKFVPDCLRLCIQRRCECR